MREFFSARMNRFSSLVTLLLCVAVVSRATAQTTPAVAPSALATVRHELSPDALFYTHVDLEGGWGQVARDLGEALKGTSLEEKHLDLPAGFEAAGLSRIRAFGMSSDAVPGGYDNRFFLSMPDGRAGLLSVFPGKAEPFLAATFAPPDTDLLLDVRLDVPALLKAILDTAVKVTSDNELTKTLLNSIKAGEDKGAGAIASFKGRAAVVVRMHPAAAREQARAELSLALPFDLFAHVDHGGPALDQALAKNDHWVRTANAGRILFTPKPADQADPTAATPPANMILIIEGEQIAAGTSQAFVEECLARKDGGLAANAAFTQALGNVASEGHLLVYATPNFFSALRDFTQWMVGLKGMAGGSAQELLMANQILAMIPLPSQPVTSVLVARDDGILVRGRSTESLKASLPFAAVLLPEFLGRFATIAVRAWAVEDARTHARDVAAKALANQLQQVGDAARGYFAANPEVESISLTALKEALPGVALPDFSAITSADLEFKRQSDVVTLAHNEFGEITHVLPLTAAQKSAIESELRKIDAAGIEYLVVEGDASGTAYVTSLVEGGWLPTPVSVVGENLSEVSVTLDSPSISAHTPGGQEIAVTRSRDALLKARRTVAQRRIDIERNLALLDAAAQKYFAADPDGASSASLEDLAGKEMKPELTAVCGEDYSGVSLTREGSPITFIAPRAGTINYQRPLAANVRNAQLARLLALERAVAAYFAKNPQADFVISGEVFTEAATTEPARNAANEQESAAPVKVGPDLTGLVILRNYQTVRVQLDSGHELEVPRTTAKR